VEAAILGNERQFDALAWVYAKKLKVPITAGSDIHSAADIRFDSVLGVVLDTKMQTIDNYVNAVRNNAISGLKLPYGRFDLYGDESVTLPIDIRDKDDRSTGKSLEEFLKT
jgi:hypothetical protein